MESNHHSARHRVYSAGSSPLLSVRVELGGRPGSNRRRGAHNPGCFRYTTATTSGDDRTRTGGLSPDKRVLCSSELRPLASKCAGGIRTHGLELMRLARTTAPLPRSLAGRSRTCGLRRPKPAGWPAPLQPEANKRVPPAGFEPAASGLRARRHRRFDHRGRKLRRQGSNLPLAVNSRASFLLDHAGTSKRKERESNPQGPKRADPFSRRDTAPVAVLPFSGPGRRRTCNPPLKRRQLCQLSYGAVVDVTGRNRTCDAPRFKRALFRTELRSREMGGAGVEPALPPHQRGALPPELSA